MSVDGEESKLRKVPSELLIKTKISAELNADANPGTGLSQDPADVQTEVVNSPSRQVKSCDGIEVGHGNVIPTSTTSFGLQ